MGQHSLLIFPEQNRYSQQIYHLQIIPSSHYSSLVDVDEEVFDEMKNFMKCLVMSQDRSDYDVVFMESAIRFDKVPHAVVECICIDRKDSVSLNVYFKKELQELGSEWSTHKKVIEICKEKGGIRK